VRAHACLASLFALSMAAHVSEDPSACAAAYKAVDAALASVESEAELAGVILDDELLEFVKGAGTLLRIGGVCGLPLVQAGAGLDGMMTLARSITDNADPAVFERLSASMSGGQVDVGMIVGEAAKLLGSVDMSKLDMSGLDLSALTGGASGSGGIDIAGIMSGMGLNMSTVLGALGGMQKK